RMVPVDRGARAQALTTMTARVRRELKRGRQIVIFPEGTRRAPGAPPAYKYGVAHVYAETGVPCLPVALNSGVVWGRRSFKRYPGTVRVEILDPIPPGLDKDAFLDHAYRLAIEAFRAFVDDDGWAIASHIALSALMSMFPFFLVLTAIAGIIGSKDLADEAARLVLEAWPEEVSAPIAAEIHNVL